MRNCSERINERCRPPYNEWCHHECYNHECHHDYCVRCIPENFIPIIKMRLYSSGIQDGIIGAQYGAASDYKLGAMPLESIPLEWKGVPCGTKSFAVTLIDYDTVPIIGFPWVHWIAANIPAIKRELPPNASNIEKNLFVQGVTSYANGYPLDLTPLAGFQVQREEAYRYGGMVPVNFPHKYTIKIFALDKMLNLQYGFLYNELLSAMEGHILGEGTLYGIYNAKITYL
ncbi:MAG: YbhB/YbcL family Raf kinase inhibitor-like protein [Clostridium sp.]